jgi:hypothetical protein
MDQSWDERARASVGIDVKYCKDAAKEPWPVEMDRSFVPDSLGPVLCCGVFDGADSLILMVLMLKVLMLMILIHTGDWRLETGDWRLPTVPRQTLIWPLFPA